VLLTSTSPGAAMLLIRAPPAPGQELLNLVGELVD